MSFRTVGYASMTFILVVPIILGTVIMRSPRTHDHISNTLRSGYTRTPLDNIEATDLDITLADLPRFSFAEWSPPRSAGDEIVSRPDAESDTKATEVMKITMRQFEYGLDVDAVELKVGVPVELTVVNDGDQVHGIWIPDFAISDDLRSGKTKVFEFTPEKTGRIRFSCNYNLCGTDEEHAKMAGSFIVS